MTLQNLINLWYLEKRPPERRSQRRDVGKVDDVEAASLGLPRLPWEIYNAFIEGHLELITLRTLISCRTHLLDIIAIQDESL